MHGFKFAIVICAILVQRSLQVLKLSNAFIEEDKLQLKALFETGLLSSGDDIQSLHYSLLGLSLLGYSVANGENICQHTHKMIAFESVDDVFYASSVVKTLQDKYKVKCDRKWDGADFILNNAISTAASSQSLYFAVAAQVNIGMQPILADVLSAFETAFGRDDSPVSAGFILKAASLLKKNVSHVHTIIEDIIPQADELDGQVLYYDGGIFATALVLDGVYSLSTAVNIAPAVSEVELLKFSRYLLSRKTSHSLRNAAQMLSALTVLSSNPFQVPVVLTPVQSFVSEAVPQLFVRTTDLLGRSLGDVSVDVASVHFQPQNSLITSNQPTTPSPDGTMFAYNLIDLKPAAGCYTVTFKVSSNANKVRLVGANELRVDVTVATTVALENVELTIVDKEHGANSKFYKIQYPSRLPTKLEVDNDHKIQLNFKLKDKAANVLMNAHQTFVKLFNEKTKQEVYYIAQADASKLYRFDLDINAKKTDYGHVSGTYSINVVIGDVLIDNPVEWNIGDVLINFHDDQTYEDDAISVYDKKAEIRHLFRQPDARPPDVVATFFTVLAMVPLFVFILIWLKLRAGISKSFLSLSAVGFQLGLGAIFVLYLHYWWNSNMFVTVRYLAMLGVPTFFFGNRLLTHLASKKYND